MCGYQTLWECEYQWSGAIQGPACFIAIDTQFQIIFENLPPTYTSAINKQIQPWLVWLSRLSASLRTKRLLVCITVRAHAWVVG